MQREVFVHQPAMVIVQTSSVDITLIREKSLSWAEAVKAAKRSSFDILCLAWSLCDNPNIQQIILSKRTPRIDCPLRKQLTEKEGEVRTLSEKVIPSEDLQKQLTEKESEVRDLSEKVNHTKSL